MSANPRAWTWTKVRERAAQLVADDSLTDTEIAKRCGITQRQLERWKKVAEFRERVESIVEATRQAVLAKGIAEKQNRLDRLNDLASRMVRLVEARAADDSMDQHPGHETGLLVRTYKSLGAGGVAEEAAFDAALVRECRETMRQAAQELGQWEEKQVVEHTGEVTHEHGVDDDAAKLLADLIARGLAGASAPSGGTGPAGVGGAVPPDPGGTVRPDPAPRRPVSGPKPRRGRHEGRPGDDQ